MSNLYRSKPSSCTAMLYTEENKKEVLAWMGQPASHFMDDDGCQQEAVYIQVTTISGNECKVYPGNYIIAEPEPGLFYPCDAKVFEARWEPEPDEESQARERSGETVEQHIRDACAYIYDNNDALPPESADLLIMVLEKRFPSKMSDKDPRLDVGSIPTDDWQWPVMPNELAEMMIYCDDELKRHASEANKQPPAFTLGLVAGAFRYIAVELQKVAKDETSEADRVDMRGVLRGSPEQSPSPAPGAVVPDPKRPG